MKIGNLDLGDKLILAPMADISDAPFRRIAKEYGAGLTFTQMVSAQGILANNFETLRLLTFNRNEKPIGVQILGNDPDIIGDAVKEIEKMHADVVDFNAGCPVSKVTNHKMGADILGDTNLLAQIIRSMADSSNSIPVSVKLRLGLNQNNINIIETARIAEENGASMIIIHTRTKSDKYFTEAKWNWLKKVKNAVNIPVVGNGSVFSPQDVLRMKEETGCDSVMVARGALGNPFIFSRYNSLIETGVDPGIPPVDEVQSLAIQHLNDLVHENGESSGIEKAKKHIIWYFKSFNGIHNLLDKIFSMNSHNLLEEIIYEHAEKIKNESYPRNNLADINDRFKNRVVFWLNNNGNPDYCRAN